MDINAITQVAELDYCNWFYSSY